MMSKGVIVLILIVVIVAVLLSAIFLVSGGGAKAPVVEKGDTVSVYYTGTFTNGTVFDSNVGKQPLVFTVGSGQMIQGFDSGVIGMKLNESRTITIPANEAYGEVNPALIITVPLSSFGNQSNTVQAGMIVTAENGEQGTITSVNSTNATIDFNSPLAGKTLVFNITVVAIQKNSTA